MADTPTRFTAHVDLSNLPADTYVSMAQIGLCRVCGKTEDLRMGACWDCCEFVAGRAMPGGHELWDKRNPENRWVCRVQ